MSAACAAWWQASAARRDSSEGLVSFTSSPFRVSDGLLGQFVLKLLDLHQRLNADAARAPMRVMDRGAITRHLLQRVPASQEDSQHGVFAFRQVLQANGGRALVLAFGLRVIA